MNLLSALLTWGRGCRFSQVDKVIGALPSFIKELSGRHVNLLFLPPWASRPCWERMCQMCEILPGGIDHIARKLLYRKWSVSWRMHCGRSTHGGGAQTREPSGHRGSLVLLRILIWLIVCYNKKSKDIKEFLGQKNVSFLVLYLKILSFDKLPVNRIVKMTKLPYRQ